MSNFGDIRSILARAPSEWNFAQLCWMLGGEDDLVEDHILVYVEEHLKRWPQDIRRHVPTEWLDLAAYTIWTHPGLAFCNAFKHEEHNHHDVTELKRVFEQPELANIKHLDLGSGWEGRDLLDILGQSSCEASFESLTIRYIYLFEEQIQIISTRPNFTNLRVLDLRYTSLRDEELMLLANSPTLRSLEELRLQGNRFTSTGIQALAKSPILANVNTLDLRLNGVGADGARALAESQHLGCLRWLDLHRRDVGGPNGARALAESRHLNASIRRFWQYHSSLSS
jgi:hypothetical protein